MKKIFIITSFIIVFTNLNAQNNVEPKFKTQFDYGIFQSSFKLASNAGNYLSAGFGYKINSEFWLNLSFIKISASGEFEQNLLFVNNNTSYHNTMVIPNFSKEWKLSNKFSFTGAIGGALIFEKVLVPSVKTDASNNIIGVDFINEGEPFDLGLFGEISINYEPLSNFYFSLNAKSYIPLYLEPDSYMIGFGIGIKL
jgi:hypothetical protein